MDFLFYNFNEVQVIKLSLEVDISTMINTVILMIYVAWCSVQVKDITVDEIMIRNT